MILNDHDIRKYCFAQAFMPGGKSMIEPFSEPTSGGDIISYGLTSAGYDLRLASEAFRYTNRTGEIVDPKLFRDRDYAGRVLEQCIIMEGNELGYPLVIPPGGYVLGRSYEWLRIPRNLKGRCVGKSTLARSLILVNTTPLEPGWEGFLTIEIGNVGPCPAKVFIMEGICQVEFEILTGEPDVDYAAKGGIYQSQTGVTPPRTRR